VIARRRTGRDPLSGAPRGSGRWAAGACVAALAGVVACLPAWADIAWVTLRDPDASYIALVPLVAAWLAWVRRQRLRGIARRGTLLGPAVVLLGAGAYLGGGGVGSSLLWHGGAVLVLIGALWSAVGRSVMLRMLPAVVALLFLVPPPPSLLLPVEAVLGRWTATAAAAVLEAFGVAAAAEGGGLVLDASGVALGAAGGVRTLAAIGLVTYAFAFATPLRQGVRVGLVLASPLIALAANMVYLTPLALASSAWPATAALGRVLGGWVAMLIAMGMLYGSLRLLRVVQVPAMRYALAYQ